MVALFTMIGFDKIGPANLNKYFLNSWVPVLYPFHKLTHLSSTLISCRNFNYKSVSNSKFLKIISIIFVF